MSGRRTLIYFDQTQNERGRLDSTYSELGDLLKDNDYDVEPYTEFMVLPKKIEIAQVIVFGCPNSSKLRQAEIDTLKKFVKSGGSLLLLSLSGGDRGLMNNMSKLGELFGITFENTALKDDRNNAGLPTMPIVNDLMDHPITTGIKDILVPSGCTLQVASKAKVIAKTSDMADPALKPVIAVSEFGKGRVMCVSSYEVFRRGGGFRHPGNKTLAINSFAWLSKKSQGVTEEVTESKKEKVTAKQKKVEAVAAKELENTLRRLTNAVFDLQKDIRKVDEKVSSVESNIESLRDQFQDFAEKTQKQLGVMIPTKQFKTDDENTAATVENEIKSLESELKSVEQLQDHIEQRHSSGAITKEVYTEQSTKLGKRVKSITKKIEGKRKEL
ncbi:MAG: hypothetical protein ACTSUB_08475, partial [Candidatus Thorarchaeota archaeon]